MWYRDKEELGSLVVNQSNKISKLEGERMEYQKKIIEAELSLNIEYFHSFLLFK